jgi:stage II sporulation protein E
MNRALIDRESKERTEDKLSTLGDAFASLSDIFYNLSERLSRPGVPELERICDGVYDRYCPSCPNRELCWGIEYAESRTLLRMLGETLASGGEATASELPDYMRRRCEALPGIIDEINERAAELYRIASTSEKTEVFAMDYAAIAEILRDAEEESREENQENEELRKILSELFSEYGFGEGGVSVYGKRLVRIVARGFDVSGTGIGMQDLRRKVSEACGFPVSEPIIELREGFMTLRMTKARVCRAVGVTRVENVGREECGDTVATFENCEDKFYALISDGMGKGREAAFTSGVSSMFLKKMLGAGNRVPTVIKMLNSFVRSKPEECSATLDLMELDLISGRAVFHKCGAAATYVRRADNLFKLSAETVPLGILRATDTAKLSFDTEDGDVIIMMSDGIAGGEDDAIWLMELLTKDWENNAEAMAKKIVATARERGSDDDASVIIIKVDRRS